VREGFSGVKAANSQRPGSDRQGAAEEEPPRWVSSLPLVGTVAATGPYSRPAGQGHRVAGRRVRPAAGQSRRTGGEGSKVAKVAKVAKGAKVAEAAKASKKWMAGRQAARQAGRQVGGQAARQAGSQAGSEAVSQ